MPLTRASERAAAEESEGGGKSKRARKPNQNSTAAFSANQPPIVRKTKRKRRDTTSKSTEKDAEDVLDVPTPKPLAKKSGGKTTTPEVIDVESSPIPCRPKPRPRPEFDPEALGDEPYKVSLAVTTVLNSRRRTTIPIQHDFNDPLQATFAELRASIENNFIRPWCKERMLDRDEYPVFYGLSFITGNMKTNGQEFIIRQELDWENLITHLRLLNYTGKAVAQGEIKLDAIWKTIERDETPPPTSGAAGAKGKGKGKGRPDTVQKLRFGRSQDVESSDKEAEDDDDRIDTPTTSKPRDSVTERARALKKSVDDSDNPLESTRKLIFNVNACHDERCPNNPGCCYITEKGEHHKVTPPEQVRWAKLAVAGEQRATIQRPPEEFLRAYLSGHNLMSWRTTGKRKSNQTTEETAPKPDQKDSQPVVVHVHTGATANQQLPNPNQGELYTSHNPHRYYSQPSREARYGSSHAHRRALPPNTPRFRQMGREGRAPVPSSPLHPTSDAEDPMQSFKEYVLKAETRPERISAFIEAFELLMEQYITPDLARSAQTLIQCGVKVGIASSIAAKASPFIRQFNEEQRVAENLLDLRSGVPNPQFRLQKPQNDITGEGEDGEYEEYYDPEYYDGDDGFFDDY